MKLTYGFSQLAGLTTGKAAVADPTGRHLPEKGKRQYVGSGLCILVLTLLVAAEASADRIEPVYELDIPAQTVAQALEALAKQTDALTLFPYDLAEKRKSNAVVGRFTLPEALDLLLRDTGLTGSLSEKRVINIAKVVSDATGEEGRMQSKNKGLVSLITTVLVGSPAAAQDDSAIDEIVVKGVRASLARSLDQKREATGIYDSIVAKDIGEFPDLNISESLQRIPGVTITRNLGEGEQVSVRGLAPQLTGMLINEMQAASAAQGDDGNIQYGRALTFDLFPSELFSGVGVYKSP